MEWQHGDYNRQASFNITLPYDFLLLCKIFNLPPAAVVSDFVKNLSYFTRNNQSAEKLKLKAYFIDYVTPHANCGSDVIRNLFQELEVIAAMHPDTEDDSLMDLYEKWRDAYLVYWFDKWNTTINSKK